MRVALVVPPRPRQQILNLLPPYPLGYLAAACRRYGHEPIIVDAAQRGWSAVELASELVKMKLGAIGITLFSSDVPAVKLVCQELKKIRPDLPLVLGGIHPSSAPQATLEFFSEAEYAMVGEAERGFPTLLDLLTAGAVPREKELSAIPGLVWRTEQGIRVNPQDFPTDLDALGMPAWDLMPPTRYQRYPPTLFVRQRPFAPIITTRGCVYACSFCAGHLVSGRKIRTRSLDLIFEEIDSLRRHYGVRELHIEDDHFTHSRARVVEFCERLLALDWKMTWTMPNGVRLDTLDLELLKLMKHAGCYFLIVGVESGSDRILKHMHKKITVAQVEEKVALIRQAGILPHALFMLGYPEETPADVQATLDLSLRLPLIGAHFSNYRPLPGTESYRDLVARGEIKAVDYTAEQGTFAAAVYAPKGMTTADLKTWQKNMLLRFYLRPRVLWVYVIELLQFPKLWVNIFRRAVLYLLK